MTNDQYAQVDPLSHSILRLLEEGTQTTTNLRQALHSDRNQVNYRLRKLEELEFISLRRFTDRIQESVDGRRRNYIRPKEASLTDEGAAYLAWYDQQQGDNEIDEHDIHPADLSARLTDVEDRLRTLEIAFNVLNRQLDREFNDGGSADRSGN